MHRWTGGLLAGLLAPGSGQFSDVTTSSGIGFRHGASRTFQKYLIETMGVGVAWLDYDGDGRLDLFFVNGAALADPMPEGASPDKSNPRYWNRLYRNTGRGTFVDVTKKAGVRGRGYGMGAAVGDYDNDGRKDLFVAQGHVMDTIGIDFPQIAYKQPLLLMRNRGGRFEDAGAAAGTAFRIPRAE